MENKSANLGDILIINNGFIKYRIIENLTINHEKEYILVNLFDFKAELWTKELHFEIGQNILDEQFVITGIIPKDKTQTFALL